MQEENNDFEKIGNNVREYINTRYNILILKITQKTANIGSQVTAIVLIGMMVGIFLLFINIAIAFYISSLLNNNYMGFFIVSGFYFLLTFIFIIGRKKLIIVPLRNFIAKQILRDEQE